MAVIHFSYAGDGGAGRAGRRAARACATAGLSATFSHVEGPHEGDGDICFKPTSKGSGLQAELLTKAFTDLQWNFIPARRTSLSNTLLSTAYPGIEVTDHPTFTTAEIIHLHWPTWGVTPATIGRWLAAGRHVFWTLHDCWPMTGGCHYPAGCEQYLTHCLKCPQIQDDLGLINSNFVDKLESYGRGGSLSIIAPSEWLANEARRSKILAGRNIAVVRNPIELDVFSPRLDRRELRASFGLTDDDLLLFFGSYDLKERRKGVQVLLQALRTVCASGELAASLPPGGRIFLAAGGRSSAVEKMRGVFELDFGNIENDEVMADVLGISDLVCVPSLEDNYPNVIVEAMACGTPCLGTPIGGIPEMIEDGLTGLIAADVNSVPALGAALLRFAREFKGSTAMRDAARAATERTNDPAIIGKQLRRLYEEALGRPIIEQGQLLRDRMTRVFAKAPITHIVPSSGELLSFPTNMALLRQMPEAKGLEAVTMAPPAATRDRKRIMTVRTYHGHHSARSGPYQYVRHLDDRYYSATHVAVPLGTELVGEQADTYRRAGVLLGAKAFGQQGNAWLAESEVLFRCVNEPFDLVHFIDGELGGWLLPALPAALFAGGRRPAIMTTFHQPVAVLEGMVNAELLKNFDGIISLCQNQHDFLASYVGADRVFLIQHGIDTGFFSPPPEDYVRPASTAFRVLLIGHWLRDIPLALNAFQAVRDAGIEAELTVISPTFPTTQRRAGITVRSGVSDEELRFAYWDADVVFIPLRDATANNALLEAMACGRPVVSTDVGGVREGVGEEAGILCPPSDVAAHAQALIRLAADPALRDRLGRAGRARAEEMDWRQAASRHDEVYRAIIERRTASVAAAAPPVVTAVQTVVSAAQPSDAPTARAGKSSPPPPSDVTDDALVPETVPAPPRRRASSRKGTPTAATPVAVPPPPAQTGTPARSKRPTLSAKSKR